MRVRGAWNTPGPGAARVSFLGPKLRPPAPDVERERAERPAHGRPGSWLAERVGDLPALQSMRSLPQSSELLRLFEALQGAGSVPRSRLSAPPQPRGSV
ncbi:unnamed protein product [Rangifer tarandus platyrhynchus]|uniref:Uncharacterized protein n=1 Tax=Rangifer tarandus platyrhynchus TaxID=3082113 RepID=A0AC59ZKZ2_RANTA